MKIARITSAPRMPQKQHAVLVARRDARSSRRPRTNTKMLSTASAFSIR